MRLLVNFAILFAALGYLACNVLGSPVSVGEALHLLPRGGKLPSFLSSKPKPKGGEGKPRGGSSGGGAIGTGEGGAIGAISGTTDDYADLIVKGQRYTRELDAAITSKAPDKVIDGRPIFERYHVDVDRPRTPPEEIKPFIAGDLEAKTFVRYTLSNKQTHEGKHLSKDELDFDDEVTEILVSKERGTIVNMNSYAYKDTLVPLGKNMRFSDQCFQAWQKQGGTSELKTLVQYIIDNEKSLNAMKRGHQGRVKPLTEAQTWGPGDDTYKALTGSDNGRPFVYMLKDHHNVLGNKKVTEIHTVVEPDPIIWYKLGPA